ncbi:MAG: hypothetical protein NC225_00690 [Clostridium sp.]|nr:hypothetical protein [Clostridium sp.]MCM1397976.1 hypothetical protein [Clostridium sp.]MCM1459388.1 hypothetical protein [Bacteroides sp.]
MKLKYFIRGLGAGIIFSAVILLAAYMTGGAYKISDEEIIKRAEKLGMIQDDKDIIASSGSASGKEEPSASEKTTTEAPTTDKMTSEDTATSEDTEESTTENTTTEATTTEAPTTEKPTTEATTTEAPTTTERTTTEKPGDGDYVKATITVQAGMGSYEVAVLLQNAGIIKDASDFDVYLNRNGYSTQIRIKSQEFNSNMSYEEIAKLLVKEN